MAIQKINSLFDDGIITPSLRRHITSELAKVHPLLYLSLYDSYPTSCLKPHNIFLRKIDPRRLPIVIDSGASRSLSPIKSDFISLRQCKDSITGINSSTKVEGIGIIRVKIIDDQNQITTLETEAYYVPSLNIRLYSPQHHFQSINGNASMVLTKSNVTLNLPSSKSPLTFPINPMNNLPLVIIPCDSDPHHSMF